MRSLALATLLLVACSDDTPTLPAEFELVGTAGTLVASVGCDPVHIGFVFGADGGGFMEFTVRLDRNEDFPGQSAYLPWVGEYAACSDGEGGALRCEWFGIGGAWILDPTEAGAHVIYSSGGDCAVSVEATIIDLGR